MPLSTVTKPQYSPMQIFGARIFVVVLGVCLWSAAIARWVTLSAMIQRGLKTTAIITGREIRNYEKGQPHYIKYSYQVAGRQYLGEMVVDEHDYTSRYQDGDPLTVTFLPERPAESLTGAPYYGGIYFGMLMGTLAFIALGWSFRHGSIQRRAS